MPRTLAICLCLTAAAVAGGCGGGGGSGGAGGGGSGGGAQSGSVSMKALRFHPTTLSIRAGQTVTWRNDDTVDHNVTAIKGAGFHSRAFPAGGTYRFTPTRAGVVDYVCTLHPGMKGALLVRG